MRIRTLPLCISSAVGSALLLAAGWLWARLVVSAFQRHEGVTGLSGLPRGAHYEFWGTSVPSVVTANVVILVAALSLFALWRRRDHFSLLALAAYFFFVGLVWVSMFAGLEFEAFD